MTKRDYKKDFTIDMLSAVEKPARYTGGEFGSVVKERAEVRIALAFPDVYEVGMSYLGFKILYHILNRMEGVAAERTYAPWVDMEKLMREIGRAALEGFSESDKIMAASLFGQMVENIRRKYNIKECDRDQASDE